MSTFLSNYFVCSFCRDFAKGMNVQEEQEQLLSDGVFSFRGRGKHDQG